MFRVITQGKSKVSLHRSRGIGRWLVTGGLVLALAASATVTVQAKPRHAPLSVKGDILLVGGMDRLNDVASSAEIFNPNAEAFQCDALGGLNTATGACNNTMTQSRYYATVTTLPNGQVLIAGGNSVGAHCGTGCLNTAEIFDPSTRQFTPTGSMTGAHCFQHTATLLQNGEVLITGGMDEAGDMTGTADLYNPASGTFDCMGLGGVDPSTGHCMNMMTDMRFLHTATLLLNGQVLIAGGNDGGVVASAELYDPASGTFNPTGTMTDSRMNHSATLIVTGPNKGDVLIAGGMDGAGLVLQTGELFQAATGTFVCSNGASPGATGCPVAMTSARYYHSATLLDPHYVKGRNGGKILIAGGQDGSGNALASAELYDPVSGTFSATGTMTSSRAFHSAQLITKGQHKGLVLIAGGINNAGNTLATAELFNPATGQFTPTGNMMTVARSSAGDAQLP